LASAVCPWEKGKGGANTEFRSGSGFTIHIESVAAHQLTIEITYPQPYRSLSSTETRQDAVMNYGSS
jgi:hypothetical protein